MHVTVLDKLVIFLSEVQPHQVRLLQVLWPKESTPAAEGLLGHQWNGTGSEYSNRLEHSELIFKPNSNT